MRLMIAAVGRLRGGPEADLTAEYLARIGPAGRGIGLGPAELKEVEARTAGDREREAELLLALAPEGARRVLLDETGEAWPSRRWARKLGAWRDEGVPAAVFFIGGPDGASERIRAGAAHTLAFGPQTWPHRLVRVMLAEQLYRAVTILCGSPYHRD